MNRPTVVTVFGILNLAYSLIGFCLSAASVPLLTVKAGAEPVDPMYAPYVQHPLLLAYMKAAIFVSGAMYVLLALSGVGLLLMKSWGRRVSVIYAAAAIVFGAIGLAIEITFGLPLVLEHTKTLADGPVRTGIIVGAYIGVAFGVVCGLGYPITLLVCVTRKSFVAAFAPPSPDAPPAE